MKYKKGTFVVVPNIDQLKGKPSELQAVFLWLCHHADEDGICFPSRRILAKESGCGIRTLDKSLAELEDMWLIEKTNRYKEGSKELSSNQYQILVGQEKHNPSDEKDITPSVKKDAVTIPNTNNIQLTVVSESELSPETKVIPGEIITIKPGQLGSHRGQTTIQRITSVYVDLFRDKYGIAPNLKMAAVGGAIDKLSERYTELQISSLLISFFNWRGMNGDSDFDQNKLISITHPFGWFYSTVNQYEVYLRNVFSLEFDNEEKVREFVARNLLAVKR